MKRVAIDSSVIIAILKGECNAEAWTLRLRELAETGTLLISSVALAEVRGICASDEECMTQLRKLKVRHSLMNKHAAMLAGEIFKQYRGAGGPRLKILADFLIAGHAKSRADALATTDHGFSRTCFPSIRLIDVADELSEEDSKL